MGFSAVVQGRAIFENARVWRYVISSIAKVLEDGVFVFDPEEGFYFRAMDPSHVVLVDLRFPRDSFTEYTFEEKAEVGVNMEDIAKILRRATKDDRIELAVDGERFSIIFEGKSRRRFTIPSLDITAEEVPEPKLEFAARVAVASDVFRDTIKDVELIGDVIRFKATPDSLTVSSDSEIGEVEIVLSPETGSIIEGPEVQGDEQHASYSLEYFSDMASAARVADQVVLSFSTDMPIRVEYVLPAGASFTFYVAPRVD